MVAKPHQPEKWRFCVDYRKLNERVQSMGWPIPNIDRLFTRLGAKKAILCCFGFNIGLPLGLVRLEHPPPSRLHHRFRGV